MEKLRAGLEEIILLADDTNFSHAARMIKIKGLASQALTDLNDAPRKANVVANPSPKRSHHAKAGNKVEDKAAPSPGASAE